MSSNYPNEQGNSQNHTGANYGGKPSEKPVFPEADFAGEVEEIPPYEAPPVISRTVVDTSGEKRGSNKKLIIVCVTIVLLVAIIAASIVFAVISSKNKGTDGKAEGASETEKTQEDEGSKIEQSNLSDEIPSLHTILLTSPDVVENNVDMIMLLIFNHEDKKIDILSIPRDTKVNGTRICEVAKSGNNINMTRLRNAVEDVTGIPVDSYMHMPISYVKDTVDIFGDVYFYVPQRMEYTDPEQDLYIQLYQGYTYLDGDEAEQLLRYRGYYGGDVDRTEIQRDFMLEAFEQKATAENLSLIPDWYSKVGKNIRTNMDEDDINNLATAVVDGDEEYDISDNIIPYTSFGEDYFYCDKAEMRDMAKELGF